MSLDQDPKRRSIALEYSNPAELPRVLAHGTGQLADFIVAIANKHNIPVKRSSELSELLSQVPWGCFVDERSLPLIAEVVSFLLHVDVDWRKKHPKSVPATLPSPA